MSNKSRQSRNDGTRAPPIELQESGAARSVFIKTTTSARRAQPLCPAGCVRGACAAPGRCECFAGWTGERCDAAVCARNCSHRGLCVSPGQCLCDEPLAGVAALAATSVGAPLLAPEGWLPRHAKATRPAGGSGLSRAIWR